MSTGELIQLSAEVQLWVFKYVQCILTIFKFQSNLFNSHFQTSPEKKKPKLTDKGPTDKVMTSLKCNKTNC